MSFLNNLNRRISTLTDQNTGFLKSSYSDFTPLNDSPYVGVLDNFLTANECDSLIEKSISNMERSQVDEGVIHEVRTSDSYSMVDYDDDTKTIIKRVCELVGQPASSSESLEISRYQKGQEYKPHFDADDMRHINHAFENDGGGQRILTAIMYLNNVDQGGETYFPKLDITVTPRQGKILLFHNVSEKADIPHPDSLHAGLPVSQGEKWIATLWFRIKSNFTSSNISKSHLFLGQHIKFVE